MSHPPEPGRRVRAPRPSTNNPNDPNNPVRKRRPTRTGQVWLLGKHRLLCGDATRQHDVERAYGPLRPLVMVTDPPYGVSYDPSWRAKHTGGKNYSLGKIVNDWRWDWTAAYRLFVGDVAYVWHGGLHSGDVQRSLADAGFRLRAQIIWAKHSPVFSRGHYHWQHEPCFYAVRRGATARWSGDRKQRTLWTIANAAGTHGNKDDGQTGHPTQKPIECMLRAIRNHGRPEHAVYDPFVGSGTTLIAAEQLGCACVGLEIDPAHCDTTIERWERYTGQRAKRE
jgi:DNA modification methylase